MVVSQRELAFYFLIVFNYVQLIFRRQIIWHLSMKINLKLKLRMKQLKRVTSGVAQISHAKPQRTRRGKLGFSMG
jgi:hypothetical protein